MKPRKHKRVAGRVIPYDREKLKAALESLGITVSDENIEPYQPWEERLLGVVNGLLATTWPPRKKPSFRRSEIGRASCRERV